MIFYHGTTLENALEIKRKGLIPNVENGLQIKSEYQFEKNLPRNEPLGKWIFLTKKFSWAKSFAEFRVRYHKAEYGDCVLGGFFFDCSVFKTTKEQKQTKPAIVELDVPDTIAQKLTEDLQAGENEVKCECSIPANYVVQILDTGGKPIAESKF